MEILIILTKKLSDLITLLTKIIIITMMSIMAAVIIAQVYMRYVAHSPLRWSEELARYLMAWVAFLGASLGIKTGAHIGLEICVKSLPQRVQQLISIIVKVILIIFLVIIAKEGIILCHNLAFQRSPAMRISMFWPYFSVPAGSIFMIIQLLPSLFENLQPLFQLTKMR